MKSIKYFLIWFFFEWVFLSIILNLFFSKGRTPLMNLLHYQQFRSAKEIVLFMLKNGAEINKTNEVFHISLFLGYSLGTIHSTQNDRMGGLRSIWLHKRDSWRWWNFCVNMVQILKSKITMFFFLWFIDSLFYLFTCFWWIKYFRDKHQQTPPTLNMWRSFLRFFFFFFSLFLKFAKNWNTIFWIGIHSHWWFN